MSVRKVIVTPPFMSVRQNVEALEQLFAFNGQWLVTVHNRRIVELAHVPDQDTDKESQDKEEHPDSQDLTTS